MCLVNQVRHCKPTHVIVILVVKQNNCLHRKAPQAAFPSWGSGGFSPSLFSHCTCIIVLLRYKVTQRLCSGISHCKSVEVHSGCFAFALGLVFHSFVFTLICCPALMGAERRHSDLSQPLPVEFTQPGVRDPLRYGSVNATDICKPGTWKEAWTRCWPSSGDHQWLLCNCSFFFFFISCHSKLAPFCSDPLRAVFSWRWIPLVWCQTLSCCLVPTALVC